MYFVLKLFLPPLRFANIFRSLEQLIRTAKDQIGKDDCDLKTF